MSPKLPWKPHYLEPIKSKNLNITYFFSELSGHGRRRNIEETDVAGIGISRSDALNGGRIDNCNVAKQILKVELTNSNLKIAIECENLQEKAAPASQETCVWNSMELEHRYIVGSRSDPK